MDLQHMVVWRLYGALLLSGNAKNMYTVSSAHRRVITVTENYVDILDCIDKVPERFEWGDSELVVRLNDKIGCDIICPYVAFSIPADVLHRLPLSGNTPIPTGGTLAQLAGVADCIVLNEMVCVARGYSELMLSYLYKISSDIAYVSVNGRNMIASKSVKFPFYVPIQHTDVCAQLDVGSRLLLRFAIMRNSFDGAVIYHWDGLTYSMTPTGVRVTLEGSGEVESVFDWLSDGYTQRVRDSVCAAKALVTVELPGSLIDKLFTSKPSPLEELSILQVNGRSVGLRMSETYVCILLHMCSLVQQLLEPYDIPFGYYAYVDGSYKPCDVDNATHWFLGSDSNYLFPDDFPFVRRAINNGDATDVIHCLNCIDPDILPKLNVMLSVQSSTRDAQ